MKRRLVIAIDGPAASGKSTAAKALAARLGYLYLDTGALYRAIAWKMIEEKIPLESAGAVAEACEGVRVRVSLKEKRHEVWLDGRNVTPFLRRPQVSEAASKVSAISAVRDKLLSLQREIGREGGIVAEGRDIGTVVFPEADLKFYLDADPAIRGRRRQQELSQNGPSASLEETSRALESRDAKDSQRSLAPLKRAEDAILIDSTDLSLDAVLDRMLRKVEALLPAASG